MMYGLHIISDDNYFLSGISEAFHDSSAVSSAGFSRLRITNPGKRVDNKLINRIAGYDMTVVYISCRRMRRALLILLGRLRKKILIMARFIPSQEKKPPYYLMNSTASPASLFGRAEHLMKSAPAEIGGVLLRNISLSVFPLLEKGVGISDISSSVRRSEKTVYEMKSNLSKCFGLRTGRNINFLLCCDLSEMFNAQQNT